MLSKLVVIGGRHTHEYATDKSTRSGLIKKWEIESSSKIEGDTQQYQPYEFNLSSGPRSKSRLNRNVTR